MRINFTIDRREVNKFEAACEAMITNVGRGTKAASIEAVNTILTDALTQVPVETGTLANSIYGGTFRRLDVKGYTYGGLVGFGQPQSTSNVDWIREPNDAVNPRSGVKASAYATKVHEDLDAFHANGGKAKFLEDPVRSYAADNFARTAVNYWKRAIDGSMAVKMQTIHGRGK